MKHKYKGKYKSDSSDESSSDDSSSSDGEQKKSSKNRHNTNDNHEYETATKRRKKYTSSEDSEDDGKRKKKTINSDDEKDRQHKVRSRHPTYTSSKKDSTSSYKSKYKDDKDNDARRNKYDDRRQNEKRRDDDRDTQKTRDDHFERHSHHHHRQQRDSEEKSKSRDDRSLDDKRRDRPWNRRRRSRSKSFDHANAKWGKNSYSQTKSEKNVKDKEKPNFGLSGKLTEETNTYKGVVIKYSEPPEATKPRRRWRLYPFKGEKSLQTLYIHRQSAYLIGRDRNIADLPVDHPSCSKQHAALQYRLVQFTREDGSVGKRVRPYIIDLESANGTFVNNKKIEPKKYVELLERDVIKFGFSSREYVLLHENSKDEALDDDVKLEDEGERKVKKEEP